MGALTVSTAPARLTGLQEAGVLTVWQIMIMMTMIMVIMIMMTMIMMMMMTIMTAIIVQCMHFIYA